MPFGLLSCIRNKDFRRSKSALALAEAGKKASFAGGVEGDAEAERKPGGFRFALREGKENGPAWGPFDCFKRFGWQSNRTAIRAA